jgi:hypothetical protein
LLDRVGVDGLPLTSAGYLKPDDVLACATELNMDKEWIGKFNREAQTFPVLSLRESAQKLGLLRKFRGRLVLTANGKKVSKDPVALWGYLSSKTPFGDACERDAGIVALLITAAGQIPDHSSFHLPLRALGWGYSPIEPIDESGAYQAARQTIALLRRLGALPDAFGPSTEAKQQAGGIAFARTALRK